MDNFYVFFTTFFNFTSVIMVDNFYVKFTTFTEKSSFSVVKHQVLAKNTPRPLTKIVLCAIMVKEGILLLFFCTISDS